MAGGRSAARRARRAAGRASLALAALLLFAPASGRASEDPTEADPVALRLERGSLARRQVVALGRDLLVEGEALSDVVAVDAAVPVVDASPPDATPQPALPPPGGGWEGGA